MSIKIPINSTFVSNNCNLENPCCYPVLLLGKFNCDEFKTIINFRFNNNEYRSIDKIELALYVKEVKLSCCNPRLCFKILVNSPCSPRGCNTNNCCHSYGIYPCDQCNLLKFDLTDLLYPYMNCCCNDITFTLVPLNEGIVMFEKPCCIEDGYIKIHLGSRKRHCCC